MRIGAHLSVAGGFPRAFRRARELGCESIQVFTRAPTSWRARAIPPEEAAAFREEIRRGDVRPVVAHAPYLLNPASPDPDSWERTVRELVRELKRCQQLGIRQLVLHPGAHRGSGIEEGLDRVGRCLRRALEESETQGTILLETTAGQGTVLGSRLVELAEMIQRVEGTRVGVCLDTAHLHGAGYDLRSPRGYTELIVELERTVGIERIRAFHANDTPCEQGARRDRHTHIGYGELGEEAFARILGDPRWDGLPLLLETPKAARRGLPDDGELDRRNLAVLRRLRAQASPGQP